MATVENLIIAAMRQIGVHRRGMTLEAADVQEGMETLNRMIDAWALENFMVYAKTLTGFSLVGGQGDYTIGTGGDFDTARPEDIHAAYVRDSSSIDHAVEIIPRETYEGIGLKSSPGRPWRLYYDPQYPLGKAQLWPVPSTAETLYLDMLVKIPQFASKNDQVNLPPGYEDCIVLNLAVKMAPEFGVKADPAVIASAKEIRARIKNRNIKAPSARVDPAILSIGGRRRFNIFTG